MVCVYVAVGAKSSAVAQALAAVRTHGAFERCLFVVAEATALPGLQWIAPAAGFTMAEFFRDRGQHALVVVDDLTRHAATHREISLLLRQPPGREAYPGDIFYLHARLLERAAKLSPARGGGSLTALPIAETQAGNLSAYIPTNLISITDGQIYLDAKLFNEGHKPAIDVGLSVSRVGGKTQAPALRQVVESLRLDYTQFLELELFTPLRRDGRRAHAPNHRARSAHPRGPAAATARAASARRRGRLAARADRRAAGRDSGRAGGRAQDEVARMSSKPGCGLPSRASKRAEHCPRAS